MAKIKLSYDKETDIPEGYAELYTKKEDRFVLTGVDGMRTDADIARVQEGLRKERDDHKKTKDKLVKYETLGDDPDAIRVSLDSVEELQAQLEAKGKDGKVDEEKLEQLVSARVKRQVGPIERERDQLKRANGEWESKFHGLQTELSSGKISQALGSAASEAKVRAEAVADVQDIGARLFEIVEGKIVTRDGVGVTPGLTPQQWLSDIQEKRPHWWPLSQGGGAQGSRGGSSAMAGNPWTAENWNITEQGKVAREKGDTEAARLAQLAGSKIGATRPPVKSA